MDLEVAMSGSSEVSIVPSALKRRLPWRFQAMRAGFGVSTLSTVIVAAGGMAVSSMNLTRS